jgi:hypothetical protein
LGAIPRRMSGEHGDIADVGHLSSKESRTSRMSNESRISRRPTTASSKDSVLTIPESEPELVRSSTRMVRSAQSDSNLVLDGVAAKPGGRSVQDGPTSPKSEPGVPELRRSSSRMVRRTQSESIILSTAGKQGGKPRSATDVPTSPTSDTRQGPELQDGPTSPKSEPGDPELVRSSTRMVRRTQSESTIILPTAGKPGGRRRSATDVPATPTSDTRQGSKFRHSRAEPTSPISRILSQQHFVREFSQEIIGAAAA